MPDFGTYETIQVDVDTRGVATLTLIRPEVRNAMNGQMYDEARAVIRALDADPSVRVLILTNVGDTFCAGGDFRYQQSQAGKPRDLSRQRRRGAGVVHGPRRSVGRDDPCRRPRLHPATGAQCLVERDPLGAVHALGEPGRDEGAQGGFPRSHGTGLPPASDKGKRG